MPASSTTPTNGVIVVVANAGGAVDVTNVTTFGAVNTRLSPPRRRRAGSPGGGPFQEHADMLRPGCAIWRRALCRAPCSSPPA